MFLKIENALPAQVVALDVKIRTSRRQDTEYIDKKQVYGMLRGNFHINTRKTMSLLLGDYAFFSEPLNLSVSSISTFIVSGSMATP